MMAPVLAVGDGALGFWGALAQLYPEIRERRCWVHKLANLLDELPKRLQPRAKALLHEVMLAPTRAGAKHATEVFA
jgi:putative transposase